MKDLNLDWANLPFGYIPTDYNVRCRYANGKWGEIEVSTSETVDLHIAATCLHYGQEIFEGLKAFRGKDGKVRVFRMRENAKRIRSSAEGLCMQPVPEDLFCEMVEKVVRLNARFIPPYGSGASLYIRPLEIGITPSVGVKSSTEYLFIILVSPVGPYFKTGFKPTDICIMRQYDRVAPKGTGRWKTGGNYAASLMSGNHAHELGYSAVLYLDPREKKYLDECGPANFFAIKDGKYITPASDSILPSVTTWALTLKRAISLSTSSRKWPKPEHAEQLPSSRPFAKSMTLTPATSMWYPPMANPVRLAPCFTISCAEFNLEKRKTCMDGTPFLKESDHGV